MNVPYMSSGVNRFLNNGDSIEATLRQGIFRLAGNLLSEESRLFH
jgi:hypothetical protein